MFFSGGHLWHYVGDPAIYRPAKEAEEWRQRRDCLHNFEAKAVAEAQRLSADDLRRIVDEFSKFSQGVAMI